MLNTILATKIGMDQTFEGGKRHATTFIEAGPCVVTQVKNDKKDGYWAVQLGFGEKKLKHTSKPMQGHLKKSTKGKHSPRFIREVRTSKEPEEKVGGEIKASDIFVAGDMVKVSGTSKGKGFAGAMKRWGFAGGPKTHGQADRQRAPGSIGQGTTPGRVYKGKKMAGRMGNERVTVKNLKVLSVDPETNKIALSGPVPGIKGGLLVVTRMNNRKENPPTQ